MSAAEFSLPTPTPQDIARFQDKYTVAPNGCHIWHGSRMKRGYGQFGVAGKVYLAHRVAYAWFVGPIPGNCELDHVKERGCSGPSCVNPAHLEPVTKAQHTPRDGNSLKTHCPQGHPYDEANTIRTTRGHRRCKACHYEMTNERRRNQNAAKNAGRSMSPGGKPSPLTLDQVRAIRAATGTYASIAARYGVARSTVTNIIKGRYWQEKGQGG